MTTSAATPTKTIELPEPGYPVVTRIISNGLFPDESGRNEPITWTVGQKHPLVDSMRVVRMFISSGGVEIYSVAKDGQSGTRNFLPTNWVRLVEEAMPIDIFAEELADAEAGGDDGDDELDPEPEPVEPPMPVHSDGPAAS